MFFYLKYICLLGINIPFLGACGACGFLRQNSRKNPVLGAPLGSLQGKKRAFGAFFSLNRAKRRKLLGKR
jgi:hypothetical protein